MNSEVLIPGGGQMGAAIRAFDWSTTPVGAIETWPQSLITAIRIMLGSRYPMFVWWGRSLTKFYNDAYIPVLGKRHPQALGQPASKVWEEIWDTLGPQTELVLNEGQSTWNEQRLLVMERNGYIEETYFTFSYSPAASDEGGIGGVFCACTEDTRQVLSDRRLRTLRELAAATAETKTIEEACETSAQVLGQNPYDVPFALIYLLDRTQTQAELVGATGISVNLPASPVRIDLQQSNQQSNNWLLSTVLTSGKSQLIRQFPSHWGTLPGGAWSDPTTQAIVLPLATSTQTQLTGFLIVGISSRRELDDDYRGFFDLVAGQITTAITNAQTYEAERKRAEALAEIDRAKTVFFSNVSHEFRTPLTLMLAPLEDAITNLSSTISQQEREQLQMVQRNGLRLLKLVNTLLDFARIEAGRVQASYELTDLAAFTADLASVFRSAIERANLRLIVNCPPLPEAMYVDREMWEKIVLNLLSNAFKFTFAGEISVELQWASERVDLIVRDTGVGIPDTELPHLFERFHRVKGTQGRSIEGSGIGLSLVQELVKLHQGTIDVASVEGVGTSFTISIPTGTAHLPPERIGAAQTAVSTALDANSYLEEALSWLPEEDAKVSSLDFRFVQLESNAIEISSTSSHHNFHSEIQTVRSRILLADDNADMRGYIKRLLSQQYEVEIVSDGLEALAAVRQQIPDLILTDVMMPNLNGFGLLRSIRSDPQTREVPIIMLSARAGEEARIEGLAAGADDYLIKPFSARELLARVEGTLKLTRLRQEAAQSLKRSEDRYRAFVQQSSEGIWRFEVEQPLSIDLSEAEQIQYFYQYAYLAECNQVMAEMYGVASPQELCGVRLADLLVPSDPRNLEYLRAFIRAGYRLVDAESYELDQQGNPKVFLNNLIGIIEAEKLVRVWGTQRDITDRKQAELEREQLFRAEQQARSAAEAANRIKDEFLAVLSHELRSPLNPILGWSRLLQTGRLDETKTKQALITIERNAKLQAELIEDLLDVSRILQGKLSLSTNPINLLATIQAAIETVRLAAEAKSIDLRFTIGDFGLNKEPQNPKSKIQNPEFIVSGDSTRLQQVVWNLLSNAVKFTPVGGRVEVRLEQIDHQAQMTVSDSGKGISPQFLPHVFDYFRQEDGATTRKFGGLGLGLAIVRYLVELHGGTIRADSPGEGLGATFTVSLPLMPPQLTIHQGPQRSEQLLDLQGIHVLVVDDDRDTREFIEFLLEQAGAKAITAASAEEALTALTRSKPDILLSDIGMPEMDGYMLMQQIRTLPPERGGTIPAIALTAYAGEINYQQAVAAGFQRHIAKPIEPQVLIRSIAEFKQRSEDSKGT